MASTDPEFPPPPTQPQEIPAKPPRKRSTRPKSAADLITPPNVFTSETQSRPQESAKEVAARLKNEAEDKKHERRLGLITHCVFAGLLSVITVGSFVVVVLPGVPYPPETMKLMSTLLTAIVSGGTAFFAGKAVGKSS